ncbi:MULTISPECIES: hypothetical protein [unclassified Ochrobactrum]|jgi:hypothetical protein|uniref:hypothetical protein n=1 Tax=unclassified Ochrobactrum TaxID=239106 RepID=UPI000DEF8516|nr:MULTISPECIES: hypothetical protein [unclassified Ochrobactrum]MBQ0710398.1 hypothetical protein [Ochrobactrum sp. AP1BH01-1]
MSAKLPPVPEDNRSGKGTGEQRHVPQKGDLLAQDDKSGKQGRQANTKINTTNQGLQQDR